MGRLFRVFIPASVIGLLISELLLLVVCYVCGAWLMGLLVNPDFNFIFFLREEGGLLKIGVVAACVIAGLYFDDLYTNIRVKSMTLLVQQLCFLVGFAFLIQALFAYARRPEWSLPRWTMIFGSILVLVAVPAWRLFYGNVVVAALVSRRVLFLGTSPVVCEIAKRFATNPELGMRVLGYVAPSDAGGPLPGGKLLGDVTEIIPIAKELNPDLIVVGLRERRQGLSMEDLLHLRLRGIQFEEANTTFESSFGRVMTRDIRLSQLVYSTNLGPRKNSVFWHSLYSTLLAVVIFVLAAPVILLVAIVVKLTSPGPILYRQTRVGFNDVPFTLYKFRSMYVDAESRTGPVWATKNDPRITPPGRWMRRLRLDELPQLFNVLRGDMSLVGPRPERPEFVTTLEKHIPYYSYRHCVKPGITGWAQINYKYGDTIEDAVAKFEYDLYYIKNLAVSLDMYILFHTAKVMLFSDSGQ